MENEIMDNFFGPLQFTVFSKWIMDNLKMDNFSGQLHPAFICRLPPSKKLSIIH
jgi:hypothetical protein